MRVARYSGTTLKNVIPKKEHSKQPSAAKTEKKIKIEHPECKRTVQGRKVSLSKKNEKIYKVTVTYIKITDEEAKIKRAIIESIMKKGL